MIVISPNPVSATVLVRNFGNLFSIEQFYDFLRRNNLLDKNLLPTERGRRNGISRVQNSKGSWNGYNQAFQLMVRDRCLDLICKTKIQGSEKESPKKESSVKKGSVKKEKRSDLSCSFLSLLECLPSCSFQCLDIPDEFIVLDTETTGVTGKDEVIELGIIDQDGNELYHSFFKNTQEINPAARKVNKISDDILKDAPCISEERDKILALLKDKVVIGHNLSFDERMLKASFERYGASFEGFYQKIDSMVLAKKYIASEKYSLESLSNLLGIPGEEKHRAVDDCRLTIHFLKNMEKMLQLNQMMRLLKE